MKVLGYAAASPAEALADPVRFAQAGNDLEEQETAIARWARAARHHLVRVIAERGDPSDLPLRQGLCEALEALRDGEADALVIRRLDRLAPDVLLQEQLLGELNRLGIALLVIDHADACVLTHPDTVRAAIRDAVASVPVFQGELRSMRARYRMLRARGTDEDSKLIELERIGERGMSWHALRLRGRALS